MSTLNNTRIYFSVRNLEFSDNIKMVWVICEITSTTTGKSLKRKLGRAVSVEKNDCYGHVLVQALLENNHALNLGRTLILYVSMAASVNMTPCSLVGRYQNPDNIPEDRHLLNPALFDLHYSIMARASMIRSIINTMLIISHL